jgi:hypothetical protein
MSDKSAHPEQALPFGRAAALYDRVRPPYPPDAVRWAPGDPPARVVDLGAGTAERVDSFGPHFGPVRRAEFRHSVTQTPDGLVGLVKSRSHYLTTSPHRQAEMEAAVRDLARRLGPTFELPYVTVVYRATRL